MSDDEKLAILNERLFWASKDGNLAEVVEALSSGASPNYNRDEGFETPLQTASQNGHEMIVDKLLQAGADPSAVNSYIMAPLHYASINGHEKIVDKLLQTIVDPSDIQATDNFQRTPLHYASINGHEMIVDKLLQAGADPSPADEVLLTPLHYASRAGYEMIVDKLLQAGADQSANDMDNRQPLHIAAMHGHDMIVEKLLQAGADPSTAVIYDHGDTPLHEAAKFKHKSTMDLLIRFGANIDAKNKRGETPADLFEKKTVSTILADRKKRRADAAQGIKEVSGKMKVARVLLHGPPRVGKTSVKHLILNQPPRNEDSTELVLDPVRAICTSKLTAIDQTHLVELNEEKMISMIQQELNRKAEESKQNKEASHQHSHIKLTSNHLSSSSDVTVVSTESPGKTIHHGKLAIGHPTKQENSKILSRIAHDLASIDSKLPSLFQCNHVHLIDSGGQPQFSNLLPLVLQSQSHHHMVVINLSEKLHDKPNNCYQIGGVKHVFPESLLLTNYQLIERACQLASGSKSKVIVVGTHLDRVNKDESLAQKNEMLAPLVKKYQYNLILTDDDQPIFAVNAMLPEGEERTECANTLQEVILSAPVLVDKDEDKEEEIDAEDEAENEEGLTVPLRWVVLELELSHRSKGIEVIDRKEIEEVAESLEVHDLDDALAFFKKLAIHYHYPEVLPDKIFTSVAPISSQLSKIVEAAFPHHRGRFHEQGHDQVRLQKTGELTRRYLKTLSSPKLKADEQFPLNDFINLMEHLRVLFRINTNTFLFPSLLPAEFEAALEMNNGYQEPLVCFWMNDLGETQILPQSFFHALTVELLRQKEVKLNGRFKQSRSTFVFDYTLKENEKCQMRLSNHAFWVELHTTIFSSQHKDCKQITSLIQSCTKNVLKQLKLTELGELHYGLRCYSKDCGVDYLHPSECTRRVGPFVFSCLVTGNEWQLETDDKRLFWFIGLSAASGCSDFPIYSQQNRPQLHEILALLKDKSARWNEIGGAFGVSPNDRESIYHNQRYPSDKSRLEAVLDKWIETTEPQSKVSWEEFRRVLKEELQFNDIIF